jgi:hypothetical protein
MRIAAVLAAVTFTVGCSSGGQSPAADLSGVDLTGADLAGADLTAGDPCTTACQTFLTCGTKAYMANYKSQVYGGYGYFSAIPGYAFGYTPGYGYGYGFGGYQYAYTFGPSGPLGGRGMGWDLSNSLGYGYGTYGYGYGYTNSYNPNPGDSWGHRYGYTNRPLAYGYTAVYGTYGFGNEEFIECREDCKQFTPTSARDTIISCIQRNAASCSTAFSCLTPN